MLMQTPHCQTAHDFATQFASCGCCKQEDKSDGYDSDTAEAVQRRLKQLKKDGRADQTAAPLPSRLYDERRERQLLRQQEQGGRRCRSRSRERLRGRRHSSSGSRERRRRSSRERSRERRRRSRSRSRNRTRGRHEIPRRRSRSRGRHSSRSRERRRRSRSGGRDRRGARRSRSRGREPGAQPPSRPPVSGTGLQQRDFEALIPGYRDMNVAQVRLAVLVPSCG
jgi:hypothetical protein